MDPESTPRSPADVLGLALGATSLAVGLLRSADRVGAAGPARDVTEPVPRVGDALVGAMLESSRLARDAAGLGGRVAASIGSRLPRPSLPGPARWPLLRLQRTAEIGRQARLTCEREAAALASALVPRITAALLDQLDLTAIVLRHVDLDVVARGLDLDAAVARVDLDAIIDRIPIDRILDRVDVDAVVARVDIDAIIDRIDIDAIARGIDIDAIAARIDLEAIVDRIDIDAIVDRVDLLGIAQYLVDALDLPGIIRQSSGAMTSDAVREVRMQSIQADELVGRAVDRLLLRRRARHIDLPGFDRTDGNGGPPTHPADGPRVITPDGSHDDE